VPSGTLEHFEKTPFPWQPTKMLLNADFSGHRNCIFKIQVDIHIMLPWVNLLFGTLPIGCKVRVTHKGQGHPETSHFFPNFFLD
jgi:hypothetical protein